MVRFFFLSARLSHAILREICIYKIFVQHISDSFGVGYVSLAHYLLYIIFLFYVLGFWSLTLVMLNKLR